VGDGIALTRRRTGRRRCKRSAALLVAQVAAQRLKAAQLTAQTTGCADSDEWVGDADIPVDGHVGTKSGSIYDVP